MKLKVKRTVIKHGCRWIPKLIGVNNTPYPPINSDGIDPTVKFLVEALSQKEDKGAGPWVSVQMFLGKIDTRTRWGKGVIVGILGIMFMILLIYLIPKLSELGLI